MNFKIDITNPEVITYITNEIGYTFLGGIRLERMDRLRVTIKFDVVN
jgi:hypothetical protein